MIWKVYTKTIEIENFNKKGTKFIYIRNCAILSFAKVVAIYAFFSV